MCVCMRVCVHAYLHDVHAAHGAIVALCEKVVAVCELHPVDSRRVLVAVAAVAAAAARHNGVLTLMLTWYVRVQARGKSHNLRGCNKLARTAYPFYGHTIQS